MCLVTQSCPTLCDPKGLQAARLFCPWGFSRQEYWSGLPCPPLGIFLTQGLNPGLPALQVDSLPSEPPGKSKNTGVGSLPLLQGIIQTQESNRGVLHGRWILYQLSYQRGPNQKLVFCNSNFKKFAYFLNVLLEL